MIRKIGSFFVNGIVLKLVALLIAFLIWLFVTNSNNPVRSITIQNVPINIINEDSIADIGKVVEPEGSDTVTLKVTERRSILNRLTRNNFYVEADLENINALDSVPLTVSCDNSAVSWDEIAISPVSLKVSIEDMVELTFAVSVTASGEVSPGYAVGKTEVIQGKTILIAGPASLVSIIGQVIAPISVSGLQEDKELTAVLRVFDKNGSEFTEGQMSRLSFKTIDGSVLEDHALQVRISLWEVRNDIPIRVNTYGDVGKGYVIAGLSVLPEAISLAGTPEAFETLGSELIVKDPVSVVGLTQDLTQEIDLTETLEQYQDIKLPADADATVTVQVDIERSGYSTVDIALSDVNMLNRPENRKLVFTPADKISVGVKADDPAADLIGPEDIRVKIDLSVCEQPGSYEIPVSIELPEGYSQSDELIIKVSSSDVADEEQPQEIRRSPEAEGEEEVTEKEG